MSTVTPPPPSVTLDDKYTAESGLILLSGIHALVRLTLDLRRLDRQQGHDTGVFISGYQGSPLAGLDRELERARRHLDPAGVVFQPGLNEELAATAVGGTQLLGELATRRKEGVTGFWFGKNPGLDRAADAIRHSNVTGTAPLGGAVAWIGDDPSSKSSTVPSSCEPMCRSLMMPLLSPGNVGEVLTLGLHAVAISRHAGLWTGMKIVADVADASATVDAAAALQTVVSTPPRAATRPPVLLPPTNLVAEHDLMSARIERVNEYARAANLNRITFDPRRPRIGVMAAGMGYQAVLRALDDLGLDEGALKQAGMRLIQLGMPWPLDAGELRPLVDGLETVLVVEDKLAFVESQLKEALYRQPHQPLVIGKRDGAGDVLLPVGSAVTARDVAAALLTLVPDELVSAAARERVDGRDGPSPLQDIPGRTPYFCSGCPHNTSTRARPDQLVGVGIGCHTMVAIDGGDRRGQLLGMSQMGGEGGQWIGLAPFTSDPHLIQNMGDGTFHHSGSLAIRAAVAAGVNITFRLLYNDAVAMTGGQVATGHMSVPVLIRSLAAESVKRVIVTTAEPDAYRGIALDPIAEVRHRDDFQEAQDVLSAIPGVTVLLHDDRCATEKRRMRKRGKLEAPPQRVWINERVCEGCGDCGEKSTCLSVLPVETAFGRKTQIHQSSCSQDFTCLKGDCPSFVLVTPHDGGARRKPPAPPAVLPEPERRVNDDVLIRMPGVGGTGVVTISSILQMAAHLEGRHAAGLEQIGLAQKGGPVISDLRIASTPITGQLRATAGQVDVLLGLDLLGAVAPETLAVLDPSRSVAVLNTDITPTAAMVTSPAAHPPKANRLIRRLAAATRGSELLTVPAETLSEHLFGDHMPANMLVVGAAYQHGCLPLDAESIERAIELNGAAVEVNRAAFRWGRHVVVDPAAVDALIPSAPPAVSTGASAPSTATWPARSITASLGLPPTLLPVVEPYVDELISYQRVAYARRYGEEVARAALLEGKRSGDTKVTAAFARGLFKLMAYKDEYEVARLHRDAIERHRLEHAFGPGATVKVLLHPPVLRAFGLKRKLQFGRSAPVLFAGLHAARHLRGTAMDPFGYAKVRRIERALIDEYCGYVTEALNQLNAANADLVAEIADLPELVRGYEEIKLGNVTVMRDRAQALLGRLPRPEADPLIKVVGSSVGGAAS